MAFLHRGLPIRGSPFLVTQTNFNSYKALRNDSSGMGSEWYDKTMKGIEMKLFYYGVAVQVEWLDAPPHHWRKDKYAECETSQDGRCIIRCTSYSGLLHEWGHVIQAYLGNDGIPSKAFPFPPYHYGSASREWLPEMIRLGYGSLVSEDYGLLETVVAGIFGPLIIPKKIEEFQEEIKQHLIIWENKMGIKLLLPLK